MYQRLGLGDRRAGMAAPRRLGASEGGKDLVAHVGARRSELAEGRGSWTPGGWGWVVAWWGGGQGAMARLVGENEPGRLGPSTV